MNPIHAREAKYYLSLGLTLVVKHQGQEVIRGNLSNPQINNFLNLPNHEYFLPINRKHRFLKYLTGQVVVGYMLGAAFSLIGLMFLSILVLSFSWPLLGQLAPFLLLTATAGVMGFKMATVARKRITKSLNKKRR
jgi:hypothetical protein